LRLSACDDMPHLGVLSQPFRPLFLLSE
jgi:hypothetical protein